MALRKPIVAGTFYEQDFQRLEEQIKSCFTHEKGPGALPVKKREKTIKAVVCPHAGYAFSGPCAAWSYKEIAESQLPDTYIILGPSHAGVSQSAISLDDWRTPLGVVKPDTQLGKALVKNTEFVEDAQAHSREHSIEVQLPFLQYVNRAALQKLRIVPIVLTGSINIPKLALDIKETLMDLNKTVVYIISSDLTHYGAMYGYLPFSSDIPKRLYNLDLGAIKLIQKRDSSGFLSYIQEHSSTICGALPLLLLTKLLPKTEGKLLQYYTSADIQGDWRNAVGYASILFE